MTDVCTLVVITAIIDGNNSVNVIMCNETLQNATDRRRMTKDKVMMDVLYYVDKSVDKQGLVQRYINADIGRCGCVYFVCCVIFEKPSGFMLIL